VASLAAVVFSVLSDDFLSTFNVYAILSAAALIAVIGLAQVAVLSVGEFSLAVGGIGALTGIVAGTLIGDHGIPLMVATCVALAIGGLCGVVNGYLVAKAGVDGFIVTLATGAAFAGLTLALTESQPIGNLPDIVGTIGNGRAGFLPYILGVTAVVAMWLFIFFRWRPLGRRLLAIGGNPEAAVLSGISRTRAVIFAHGLSGFIAATAGLMVVAQQDQADPTVGSSWLLQSFTVAIIGGTALTGGVISVGGALIGSLILAIISNGLVLLGTSRFWVTLIEGILVFAAILLARASSRERVATVEGNRPFGRMRGNLPVEETADGSN